MEYPREWPLELLVEVRADVAQLQATVGHLTADVTEVEQDLHRLDGRVFQLLVTQIATLGAALAALVAALLS